MLINKFIEYFKMSSIQSALNLSCRIEMFSSNKVTVFSENFGSVQFAQQLALIKNMQVFFDFFKLIFNNL